MRQEVLSWCCRYKRHQRTETRMCERIPCVGINSGWRRLLILDLLPLDSNAMASRGRAVLYSNTAVPSSHSCYGMPCRVPCVCLCAMFRSCMDEIQVRVVRVSLRYRLNMYQATRPHMLPCTRLHMYLVTYTRLHVYLVPGLYIYQTAVHIYETAVTNVLQMRNVYTLGQSITQPEYLPIVQPNSQLPYLY